jgi:hypothetical protein
LQSKITGKLKAQVYARPMSKLIHSSGTLRVSQGEVFVDAFAPVQLSTESAFIHAGKGALASVKCIQGNTYIKSCSPRGTVFVEVAGKSIELNPGEELLVTDHKPDASEVRPADGLGRRHCQTTALAGRYITLSDFSIITLLSNTDSMTDLVHSRDSQSRRLVDRMLKTAAAVDLVMKYKGSYYAR